MFSFGGGFAIISTVFSFVFVGAFVVIVFAIGKSVKNHTTNESLNNSGNHLKMHHTVQQNYICEYCGSVVDGNNPECPNCGANRLKKY